MAKFSIDRKRPPKLTAGQAARLDAMSDEDIAAAARSDPDNPPLTADELKRIGAARRVRAVRMRSGLSQTEFARAFHINVARLRDLEQGRTQADRALLRPWAMVIDEAPDTVRRGAAQRGLTGAARRLRPSPARPRNASASERRCKSGARGRRQRPLEPLGIALDRARQRPRRAARPLGAALPLLHRPAR